MRLNTIFCHFANSCNNNIVNVFEKSHVMINIHDTERVSAGNETEINYKVQY